MEVSEGFYVYFLSCKLRLPYESGEGARSVGEIGGYDSGSYSIESGDGGEWRRCKC